MIIIIIINEIDAVIKIWSLQVEGERGREEREEKIVVSKRVERCAG